MSRLFALLLLPCLAAAAAEGTQSVAAVQKVIQMLTDMSAKTKQEKNDAEVEFAKFSTWCSQESTNLKSDIKGNGEEIESLTAEIGKLSSDIEQLGDAIAKLQEDEGTYEAQLKRANEKREKDHASFKEEEQDYSESVDAVARALTMLNKEDYDRTGDAASLLQVSEIQRLPARAKDVVTAFIGMLGSQPSGMDYEAPEANAYEFQSGGIIEMLKRLQDEFRDKLATCQKEEMNSKHAYDMVVADLTDSIENAGKDLKEKSAEKERKASKKAQDKKQLGATIDIKADNEEQLKDMTAECSEKKMSYEEKQQLRTEEIEAIAKASEILESGAVSGNAEKHLSLLQKGRSFLQVKESNPLRRQVRDFLEGESRRLKSKSLALLSQKISADPFAKVKSMIDSMITRLLKEAQADAEHEGFCDKEMGENKVTRNKLTEDIDALSAAVEDGKSTILSLTESTETLQGELEALTKAMGSATDLRTEEKAKNEETIEDSKVAQKAVEAATAVLKEFYEKAAMATGFLQLKQETKGPFDKAARIKMNSDEWKALANPAFEGEVDSGHKEGMQTFGEKETGSQDQAKYGVLALLEVVLADFANVEAETKAAESEAQEMYERFMVESKKSKATKERKVEMNDSDKAAAEAKLQEDIKDLKTTQDELLAADRYYEKLVPQCVDQGMTWEERVAAREAEIASLKEALKILGNPDIETSA